MTTLLEQLSVECHKTKTKTKTKTKVITLANYQGQKQINEPVKTLSKYM